MRKHTKEFKSSISTFGRELDSKITVVGTGLILGKEDLFSITPITNSTLLKSVMKEVDFESKKQIGIGQEVNIKSGVKVNNEYEYIDYGNYSVYKSEYKAETDTYSHICYDKMLKTMIDYTPLDITYPINLREYINAIATKCGLEFADKNSAFANYNTLINEDHFSNGNYTFRDVLDYIAQLVGGWLCINDNDELEIRYPELAKNYDKVSGENVSFISNVEDEINTIIVDGKSEQATRSGKNLFDISKVLNNGTKVVNNGDGTLSVQAYGGSGGYPSYLKTYCPSLKVGDKVILTFETTSTNKFIYLSGSNQKWDIGIERTITQSDLDSSVLWYSNDNSTTATISNIMIRLSSIIDDTYEPYGVMPSPDYPSEIESVKGKNLFDKDNATTQVGYFRPNGAINSGGGSTITTSYTSILPNTDMTISGFALEWICFYDKNKNFIERVSGKLKTFNKNAYYIRIQASTNVFDLSKIQLEKGTVATNYLPYNTIQVKDVGKNLLNLPDGTYTNNGITAVISNGVITINGEATSNSFINIPINLELESNFSISLNNTAMGDSLSEVRLQISGSNFRSVSLSVANNKRENISIYGTYTSLLIRISSGVTITNGIIKPQVELGYTTDYEPYQQNTSLFVLDQPLRSLPNGVKDIAYIKNNILYVDRKVGTVVLDGSDDENWTLNGTNQGYGIVINDVGGNSDSSIISGGYCDCLSETMQNNIYSGRKDNVFATIGGTVHKIYVRYNSSITSIALLKEQLNSQPIIVQYELAEPYTEKIGEVDNLSTFKGINNVSLDANMETNMTITYPTEYEELDKHFLKDVNVSFYKKYGAVNSVVFSRGNGSDNIYRKDNMSISRNGLTEIKITGNPFLEGNDRENFIQQLFDKINGLEFYIMDVASTGIMYLELGDLYYFNMIEEKPSLKSGLIKSGMRKAQGSSGGKFLCLLMNDEIKITQGLEESIYSDEPEITETNYKTASITDTSIKNAIIQTNKNSAEILLKVNSDEVVSAINLSPENIKISSAKLDIDAIATFTNSKLAEAGSTVINGANITTGSINCDRLNGGTINGQAIRGGSISIEKGVYYFNMGTSTSNPNCSGLNVGGYGVKAYSDITATGFAITDGDTGKSQSINIYDGHGRVWYLTFTGGILTASEYK